MLGFLYITNLDEDFFEVMWQPTEMPVPHQNHLFMSGDDSAIHVERINDLLEPLCGFPGIRNMCRFLKILEYLLNLHRCFCVINIFF